MVYILHICRANADHLHVFTGQSGIPQGVFTRCYSTSDCSGPENNVLCQLFNRSVAGDLNHCCYENETTLRSNPENLSFRLNGGTCKTCDGKVIGVAIYTMAAGIYSYSYI